MWFWQNCCVPCGHPGPNCVVGILCIPLPYTLADLAIRTSVTKGEVCAPLGPYGVDTLWQVDTEQMNGFYVYRVTLDRASAARAEHTGVM